MATYSKTHRLEKAAEGHIKNIKKRGGKASLVRQGSKNVVNYEFADNVAKKKAKKRK